MLSFSRNIVRNDVIIRVEYGPIEIGPGELHFNKSLSDPLHEIPVLEVTTAAYVTKTNFWLLTGETLAELIQENCYPYFFTKYDWDLEPTRYEVGSQNY